ncbi:ABC transporter ATP-binding protein [Ligilactobacillus sp. LYQ135]
MSNEILIKLDSVYKKYNQEYIIKNLSLQLPAKKFIAIMGASGSGKTTLLNMISTLDKPSKGNIYVNGINICNLTNNQSAEFRKKQIGFIFQNYKLLKSLTIRENIAISLSLLKISPQEINRKIEQLAHDFGISEQLDKYPYELSGGQQQRAAIIRAIIKFPQLIIADEPTGALDSQSAKNIMEYLRIINKSYDTSILMVTHDSFAASYADEVIFIKDGQIKQRVLKKDTNNSFQKVLAETLVKIERGGTLF